MPGLPSFTQGRLHQDSDLPADMDDRNALADGANQPYRAIE